MHQTEVSFAAGLCKNAVFRIESGKESRSVARSSAEAIAAILKERPENLFPDYLQKKRNMSKNESPPKCSILGAC